MKLLADRYPDLVTTTHPLTEIGRPVRPTTMGRLLDCYVAQRGAGGLRVLVRGTAAHVSARWGADNALIKAGEVVRRLDQHRPQTRVSKVWTQWVTAEAEMTVELQFDESRLHEALPSMAPELARTEHACTHNTVTPTVIRGGGKVNTTPDVAEVLADVRPGFGEDLDELIPGLRLLLHDLVPDEDIQVPLLTAASASAPGTRLRDVLQNVASEHHPGGRLVPALKSGQTNARHLRPRGTDVRLRGAQRAHHGCGVLVALPRRRRAHRRRVRTRLRERK